MQIQSTFTQARAKIMGSKGMKDLFLHVLGRAKGRYDFAVINFCIMGNHVHLIIRPGEREDLSRYNRAAILDFESPLH